MRSASPSVANARPVCRATAFGVLAATLGMLRGVFQRQTSMNSLLV